MNRKKLRVVSWNINCGLLSNNIISHTSGNKDGITYLIRCLKKINPDLVCMQEFIFPSKSPSDSRLSEIAEALEIKYFRGLILSPSHLINNTFLGLAILSRFPIKSVEEIFLPNPRIKLENHDGSIWNTHDKGLMIAKIKKDDEEFHLICGHLIPFRKFRKDPLDREFKKIWDKVDETLTSSAENPTIGCIDFNTDRISELLTNSLAKKNIKSLIHQPTRPSNHLDDQFVISKHWTNLGVRVLPSGFDHYMCFADLVWKNESKLRMPQTVFPESFSLLHLSDLHFGDGTKEDVEWKTYIEKAHREQRQDRLIEFIRELPNTPDYVVVSGDITIRGSQTGFKKFNEMMSKLIKDELLPDVNKILVVPGNHDVERIDNAEPEYEKKRWESFMHYIGEFYARPWFPDIDHEDNFIIKNLERTLEQELDIVGGLVRDIDAKVPGTKTWSYPFIIDRKKKLLLYAFNSACISGSQIKISDEVKNNINWLRNLNSEHKDKIKIVINALEKELSIDPARIDPREIALFNRIVHLIKNNAKEDFDGYLKIAVLHHHVAPLLTEEVKKFELLLNAGRFKHELSEAGFQLVLHGHKHAPQVFQETAIPKGRILSVVSGGTIGGGEAPGKQPGFYWLKYEHKQGFLSTRFVQLKSTGHPDTAFNDGETCTISLRPPRAMVSKSVAIEAEKEMHLKNLYSLTEASLTSHLRIQQGYSGDTWFGWSKELDNNRVSTIATAFGLKITSLVGAKSLRSRNNTTKIIDTLRCMELESGGWSASSQRENARPEPTAFVLWAMHAWNLVDDLQRGVPILENLIDEEKDPVFWQNVYPLALVTRILAEIAPKSTRLTQLSEALKASSFRDSNGKILYWSRQTLRNADDDFSQSGTQGSILHTALAILSLARTFSATERATGASNEDLRPACEWLLSQPKWLNTSEEINRLVGNGKYETLVVNHFTAPWVVLALLEVDVRVNSQRTHDAIYNIYQSHLNGLWDWESIPKPIWATYDALASLTEYALATAKV